MIKKPIEQRNTAKGNPNAILHYDRPLSNRQDALLSGLPHYDSRLVVPKKGVNMRDLAALTAKTGDEYAMFTKGNERLVIRGNAVMTNVSQEYAQQLFAEGYRWSGHTHPGTEPMSLSASAGDYAILKAFKQRQSMIANATGNYDIFGGDES